MIPRTEIERLIAAGDALATLVQMHVPEDHHNRCGTRSGSDCDCYMRRYSPDRAALASWADVREGFTS